MGPRIRIGHLTSRHQACDPRIFHKECHTLAAAGYEVVLIAPEPVTVVLAGIRVRAVPRPGSWRDCLRHTLLAIFRAALQEDCAVYHFHDPELILVGLGLKLAGRRVVYDAHENVPLQLLGRSWIPAFWRPLAARAAAVAEQVAGRMFDGIVAATPEIAARFPASKTVVVQNFPQLAEFPEGAAPDTGPQADVISYIGNISAQRGAFEMIEAMRLLPAALPARLAMAGLFAEAGVEAAVHAEAVTRPARVEYCGWLDREGVRTLLLRSRIGLVVLHPSPSYQESYPTKLFEYMAAGVPVIASDFPLFREIVSKSRCGLLVDPLSPGAIAMAVTRLLTCRAEAAAMGQRGREAALTCYNWSSESAKLLAFYEALIPERLPGLAPAAMAPDPP